MDNGVSGGPGETTAFYYKTDSTGPVKLIQVENQEGLYMNYRIQYGNCGYLLISYQSASGAHRHRLLEPAGNLGFPVGHRYHVRG